MMKRALLSALLAAALLTAEGMLPRAAIVEASVGQRVLQAGPPAKPRFNVTDLGTVGGACEGHAISNKGHVAGYCVAGSSKQAFLWKDGAMQGLGTLGGNSSEALGVNDSGQVTGMSLSSSGYTRAFLWENGAMHDLGAPTSGQSIARAINNAGQVAGSTSTPAFRGHAYLWQPGGGMTDLGSLDPNNDSQGWGINDAGQVTGFAVVGDYPDIEYHLFRWKGSMQDLGTGGHRFATGKGINDNGDIVGALSDSWSGPAYAFVAKGGAIQSLGVAGSDAFDINNGGLIVGQAGAGAVLWEDGVMKNLDTLIDPASGWKLTSARAINERGQITGYGTFNGQPRAFLLTPSAYYWIKPAGGAWKLAANWDPKGIPGDGDTAVFALNGQYAVDATAVAAAQAASTPLLSRIVISGTGTVELNNLNFALTSDTPTEPGVAVNDGATAVINSGAASFTHAVVGGWDPPNPANSPIARLQVFNNGTSLTGSGRLTVGDKGAGDLFVANGAHLTSAESRLGGTRAGTAVVGGDGSLWETGSIAVGYGVSGTLTIENGGRVESNDAYISFGPFSSLSEVTIDGVHAAGGQTALWALQGDLRVGQSVIGFVDVLNGGDLVVNQDVHIRSGGVSVDGRLPGGDPSELHVLGSVYVGGAGSANLLALWNAAYGNIDGDLIIGKDGAGAAVLWGRAVKTNLTQLDVVHPQAGLCAIGREFEGAVGLDEGGLLRCRNIFLGKAGTSGAGSLYVNGGKVSVLEVLRVGETGSGGGSVTMMNNAQVTTDGTYIAPNGEISGTGTLAVGLLGLTVAGTLSPGIIVSSQASATAEPGARRQAGPATLTISGTLTISPTGRLEIPVTGNGAGEYGSVAVTGTAALDGVLALDFRQGFAPRTGDVFALVTATGGVTGEFDGVEISGLAPGFTYKVISSSGQTTLEALSDGVASLPNIVLLPMVSR